MGYSEIQSLFAAKATSFATTKSLGIYFENQKYAPVSGNRHLQVFFLPAASAGAALGEDAPNKIYGVFQVNVCVEASIGYGEATAIVDSLCSEFKRGTKLAKNGVDMTITRCEMDSHESNELWYIVSVNVFFYAFSPSS